MISKKIQGNPMKTNEIQFCLMFYGLLTSMFYIRNPMKSNEIQRNPMKNNEIQAKSKEMQENPMKTNEIQFCLMFYGLLTSMFYIRNPMKFNKIQGNPMKNNE